jgi:hypothetical protein
MVSHLTPCFIGGPCGDLPPRNVDRKSSFNYAINDSNAVTGHLWQRLLFVTLMMN